MGSAKARIKGKISMDGKEVDTKLAKAKQSAKTFVSGIKSIGPALVAAFSVGVLIRFISKLISAASMVEDFTMQFKILLRSQSEARAIMADLKKFSGGTPFQLGDIANASQQLLTFSEGTMGGVKALTLFGDAAAATGNTDLPNVAYWVGRLYASLKTGRPFIDSANSLQRLKMMAPSTVSELLKMREEGKSGAEMWDVFTASLKKYEGGMEDLSTTVSGKTSTMKDNWVLAWAAMGDAFKPLTLLVLDYLTKMANKVERFTHSIQRAGAFWGAISMGQGFGEALESSEAWLNKKRAAGKLERELSLKMQGGAEAAGDDSAIKKRISSIKKDINSTSSSFGKSSDNLRQIGAGGGIAESNIQEQLKIMRAELDIAEQSLTKTAEVARNTENSGGLQ